MSTLIPVLVLIGASIAAPAAPQGQTSPHERQILSRQGAGSVGARPSFQANAGMLRPVASDLRASGDRLYSDTLAPWSDGPTPTAVDYNFATDGLVGSVGYRRVIDTHPLDVREVDLIASSQFGRQSDLVGATLSYAFR